MPEYLQSHERKGAVQHSLETHLNVQLRHRIGALQVDVGFKLTQPWTILFGPSGSGKTTILRAIAGLLHPGEGQIVATTMPGAGLEKSETLLDTQAGVFVSAHRRRIPLAAQQPNLFPHLKVIENICFGGSMESSYDILRDFALAHTTGSFPRQLSGGEAQRVNLARAVAASGSRMLLFDEPFTGMDAARRDQLLPLLQSMLAKRTIPVLSVTHDVAEAFQLGAEVIKIADGKIVQQGPVEVVLAEERAQLLRQLNGTKSPT